MASSTIEEIQQHLHTERRKPSVYIPALDGIRALAFFCVFFTRAGLENVEPGGFGVTVVSS